MTNAETIHLFFLHPRGGKRYEAEVTSTTTAGQAVKGLTEAGFLGAPGAREAYVLALARTQESIPHDASLMGAGAKDGDEIAVNLVNEGA